MSEENTPNTPATETTPPAVQETKAPPKSDELPDWARKQISDANQEAAKFRVQAREAQTALAAANDKIVTLSTEKTTAESSHVGIQGDFDKLVAAVKTLFPEETNTQVFTFAKTLQGSTGEELSAHALELSSMFGIATGPQAATDRSQGHGAGTGSAAPADQFASFVKTHLR